MTRRDGIEAWANAIAGLGVSAALVAVLRAVGWWDAGLDRGPEREAMQPGGDAGPAAEARAHDRAGTARGGGPSLSDSPGAAASGALSGEGRA